MTRRSKEETTDDLRPEYDLGELLKSGVRGKYVGRLREGTSMVLLEPDVAEAFPTDEAVNAALRLVIQLARLPRPDPEKTVEGPASATQ